MPDHVLRACQSTEALSERARMRPLTRNAHAQAPAAPKSKRAPLSIVPKSER